MEKIYKLNLNDCVYWQSNNECGNIDYNKNKHNIRSNDLLNNIFLIKLEDNKFVELDSKIIIIFDGENVIKPLGVNIPLSSITPCKISEIRKTYKKIDLLGLTKEYRKIIKELLVISEACEIASEKRLRLKKRY